MEKSDGDDLFKDYFESLNPTDILADPVCEEDNDPLGIGTDLNFDSLGPAPENNDILEPITSLIEEDLISGDPSYNLGDGTSHDDAQSHLVTVDTVIKQELFDDPIPGPSSSSSSAPPPPQPAGLRIAGFAVDPDMCSILQPSNSQVPEPLPQVNIEVNNILHKALSGQLNVDNGVQNVDGHDYASYASQTQQQNNATDSTASFVEPNRLAWSRFGQVGDQVGQVKDQVGQGQGQELDNNYPSASLRERNLIQIKFPFAEKQFR